MSKEVENLKKNGVLNGESVISNHIQQQQQQTKLNNNSNADRDATTKAIVGGRLQFYKDGKFILELARAREGEKTGWISVPRKTYWPPTISTNSSTTFSKHESSTSLSYSDDNSSIQSPFHQQRDHCWKQTQPRHNISKEMAFFFNRPSRLHLSGDCQKIGKSICRRPLNKNGNVRFIKKEQKKTEDASVVGNETKSNECVESDEKGSPNDSKESIDSLDGPKVSKLDKVLKKLADRMASRLALNGNGTNGHLPSTPTSYSLASHIASTINSQQPHQHVSPRKRILRELEKVSLEDSKRSRPKTAVNGIGNNNNNNNSSSNANNISTTTTNGSLKNDKTPPVSRHISSYSITSLLAHNTPSTINNNSINNNNSTASNDSSSTSQFLQQQQHQQMQRASLSGNSPPKSPSLMHHKRKSPNTTPPSASAQSPAQSPSPEHHAFHKYRPATTTPSSPYNSNSSYHSPNYIRGSPSPHSDAFNSRLRTSGNYQHSPSHYGAIAASSPSQNYSSSSVRDSSLSPNNASNPQNAGIRTVPKKTAALRQQFSSPTTESSSKLNKNSHQNVTQGKSEKAMDVDALLRPSVLIPPPMQVNHPAAALSHYPYMYSPLSYLPPTVPPYYSFYNPMMAAAAAYRFPIPGYPGTSPVTSTMNSPPPPALSSANGQMRSSSIPSSPPATHPYVPHTSPWNQLTNHSINDGNLIPKVKDEPSSDVPLNLSKH